ncbi:MAG: DEAD/DEAH box helicase [Desulfobacterales bacterium]|nr:DEAD/DEAH box helicase [Desulfobacterales bacterium]
MPVVENVGEYIHSLKNYARLANDLVFHKVEQEQSPIFGTTEKPFDDPIQQLLKKNKIRALFSHQAEAINHIRNKTHTVIATPTASGKTLIYNLPVFESIIHNPHTRALYVFPLKALAQDQLGTINQLAAHLPDQLRPTAAIYDGDTTQYIRTKIRQQPPNILLTNPEMLHLAFLPYHVSWKTFFSNLAFVVIDEVHTYRGVLGSHMAWVFKRLNRICDYYHASPVFIFCSATIRNPGDLANQLSGITSHVVINSGAPVAKKHYIFLNSLEGATNTAIQLLHAAIYRQLRTIVYTQSRKMTELISIWCVQKAKSFANRISAYRAGFLPEERRNIERRLATGELLAVISTSALELGIDIGNLDLCILVGYPGSIMASRQRAGRVGRDGRESAVILIGHEDALDQYFMSNPNDFFTMPPEMAVINPYNEIIMRQHLECTMVELPIHPQDKLLNDPVILNTLQSLEKEGRILRSEQDGVLYSTRQYPHREIHLRGSGKIFPILRKTDGQRIGTIDGFRAFHETHPGALYLHNGVTYIIDDLDIENSSIYASPHQVNYYTQVRVNKETEILEQQQHLSFSVFEISFGKLRVTEQVTGYEKRVAGSQKAIQVFPLDLPPIVFETKGIWIEVSEQIQEELEKKLFHFMGGLHALEHALIGTFPLVIMTDRNDLGGFSISHHPQIEKGVVFIYDGFPGGIGLCENAFDNYQELLKKTKHIIETCKCEYGCPLCVHSPKCGSGNRPIDKTASLELINAIVNSMTDTPDVPISKPIHFTEVHKDTQTIREDSTKWQILYKPKNVSPIIIKQALENCHYAVLDIETQRSAHEVGGWNCADKMGVSCAVLYDSRSDTYDAYIEKDISFMIQRLQQFHLIIGFNIVRFDYRVLSGYSNFNFNQLYTLDILLDIYKKLHYRLSLDHLAHHTLGTQKSATGLMALKWWKTGEIQKIIDYCRQDVHVTRQLFIFGLENGYLIFKNKAKQQVRLPVGFQDYIEKR